MSSTSGRGRRGRWGLVVAVTAGLLVAACGGSSGGGSSGTSQQATGSPIKIGVLNDNSPFVAVEGAEMRVNTDLAVSQINSSGGIHGHPLQVTYVNPQAQPDQAITLAQQLVQQQGVDVLVGAVLSSECLGVEGLMPRLQIVYATSTGCATDVLTSKQCNNYTFRVTPAGPQAILPLTGWQVNTYGKKWSIIYPDYAFGQSQLASYKTGLAAAGGALTQIIPIPQNEPNMTPYITKIATDGSVNGLINTEVGADLVRASNAIAQFGINKKMPIVGVFGKERFGGVYPDELTGDIGQGPELSADPNNQYDTAYHKAFRKQLAKEDPNLVNSLGGTDKAVPGDLGYSAYTTINFLKLGMLKANFTGKADTQKLINALAHVKSGQSADFPGGAFQMNPNNHQGAQTTYIAKINGQNEQVLSTIPASKLPPIGGGCNVSSTTS
jgi:ABC-type branched-subunit amino acid transport system substrate-binding protein